MHLHAMHSSGDSRRYVNLEETCQPKRRTPSKRTRPHKGRAAAKPAVQEPVALTQQADLETLQRAFANPRVTRPSDILALQRTVGNRAVTRLIQTRLTVGPAGDRYEQEADRVAEQVVSGQWSVNRHQPAAAQSVQRQEEEEEVQTKPLAASITPLVQRQAAPEEEEVQTKSLPSTALRTGIQRRGDGGLPAGSDLEQRLAASRGDGSPLPAATREFMETRFGADFGGVRVHLGSEAARLSRSISAQAFTLGQDIYMSEGKYDPGTAAGQRLLAHELTHVVQQTGAGSTGNRPRAAQTKPSSVLQRNGGGSGVYAEAHDFAKLKAQWGQVGKGAAGSAAKPKPGELSKPGFGFEGLKDFWKNGGKGLSKPTAEAPTAPSTKGPAKPTAKTPTSKGPKAAAPTLVSTADVSAIGAPEMDEKLGEVWKIATTWSSKLDQLAIYKLGQELGNKWLAAHQSEKEDYGYRNVSDTVKGFDQPVAQLSGEVFGPAGGGTGPGPSGGSTGTGPSAAVIALMTDYYYLLQMDTEMLRKPKASERLVCMNAEMVLIDKWLAAAPGELTDDLKFKKSELVRLKEMLIKRDLSYYTKEEAYVKQMEALVSATDTALTTGGKKIVRELSTTMADYNVGTLVSKYHLTDAEIAALRIYTDEDYRYINASMLDETAGKERLTKNLTELAAAGSNITDPAETLKLGKAHAKMAKRGLKHLPPVGPFVLRRGMRMTRDILNTNFKPGPYIWPTLTSTTTHPTKYMEFATNRQTLHDGRIPVVAVINQGVGRDLGDISIYGRTEGEVMLLPGTECTITEIKQEEITDVPTGNRILADHVYMTQQPPKTKTKK